MMQLLRKFTNILSRARRRWAIGVLLLGLVLQQTSTAQTITRMASWDQPGQTLADLPSLVYTLKIDALAPIVLAPSCTMTAVLSCQAPITFTAGPHTLTLTVTNAFGSASAAPLTGTPPVPAVNVKVTVTVTVP